MNTFPIHRRARAGVGLAIGLLALAGCATTKDAADGPKILLDGDQYVTLDATIGSHLKRRIKLADVKEPGVAPTRKDIVTPETDTTMLPPTAGEMERMVSDRGTGGR